MWRQFYSSARIGCRTISCCKVEKKRHLTAKLQDNKEPKGWVMNMSVAIGDSGSNYVANIPVLLGWRLSIYDGKKQKLEWYYTFSGLL